MIFPEINLYSEEDSKNSKDSGIIVDLTAPPVDASKHQDLRWKERQAEIWRKTNDQQKDIENGDAYFQSGKYNEALKEYVTAVKKAYEYGLTGLSAFFARRRVAITHEALGNFPSALLEIDILIQDANDAGKKEYGQWKQALQAATQGRYDVAVQYYKERLAIAKDWEKKSEFLEQRLRLMEERARAAGQTSLTDISSNSTSSTKPDQQARGIGTGFQGDT